MLLASDNKPLYGNVLLEVVRQSSVTVSLKKKRSVMIGKVILRPSRSFSATRTEDVVLWQPEQMPPASAHSEPESAWQQALPVTSAYANYTLLN